LFEFINHYSVIFVIPILIIALAVLVPIRTWQKRIAIYISVVVIGLVVIFNLQPGDSSVATESQVEEIITSGQPVFVEFFSNTCTACLASEPIVKSLEGAIKDNVHVLKVNVQDPIASQLMRRYKAYVTPTFIVVGPGGEEVWRQSGGFLDKQAALEALDVGA